MPHCRTFVLTCAAFLLPALQLQAKVYYINKGVKYHIGDNKFDRSEDALIVGTYPVVGKEWIQAFRVTQPDQVKVTVEHVWGVDDCPYCKVMVSIDDWAMGRLSAENNHFPFETLEPLAKPVQPGKTYYLKIDSSCADGSGSFDDFVIENVTVQTQHAEVIFLSPGPVIKNPEEPMPPVYEPQAPAPAAGCEGLLVSREWLAGALDNRPLVLDLGEGSSQTLARLAPGQSWQLRFKVSEVASGDKVSQALELRLGGVRPSGWVLSFQEGRDALYHGNLLRKGRYSRQPFGVDAYYPGAWNTLKVSYCREGGIRAWLNASPLAPELESLGPAVEIKLRLVGLRASFSKD